MKLELQLKIPVALQAISKELDELMLDASFWAARTWRTV